MTMTSANCTATRRTPVPPRVSMFAALSHVHAVWRQRQILKSLNAAALRDIGLTREQANAEANRPFWDAPEGWTR